MMFDYWRINARQHLTIHGRTTVRFPIYVQSLTCTSPLICSVIFNVSLRYCLNLINSGNGLSPERHQAITATETDLSSFGTFKTNFFGFDGQHRRIFSQENVVYNMVNILFRPKCVETHSTRVSRATVEIVFRIIICYVNQHYNF